MNRPTTCPMPLRRCTRRHAGAAVLALALFPFGLASALAQAPLRMIVPEGGSLLPIQNADRAPKTQAVPFSGTVVLHGFLVARWLPSGPQGRTLKPHFHLLPAPESAAGLPHFEGHRVSHLSIRQGMKVLAQATSPGIAREFASRQRLEIHAEGLFSLRQLSVDALCLSHARAQVEQVDPIGVSFQAAATAFPGCEPG